MKKTKLIAKFEKDKDCMCMGIEAIFFTYEGVYYSCMGSISYKQKDIFENGKKILEVETNLADYGSTSDRRMMGKFELDVNFKSNIRNEFVFLNAVSVVIEKDGEIIKIDEETLKEYNENEKHKVEHKNFMRGILR